MFWYFLISAALAAPHLPTLNVDIGQSSGFEEASQRLQKSMNMSVDPCQDFFEFACGNWVASHPILSYMSSSTQFTNLRERVKDEMKELYEQNEVSSSKAINMVRTIYRTCTDLEAIDKIGTKDVLEHIAEMGYFPLVHGDKWKRGSFNLSNLWVQMAEKRGLHVFFETAPTVDTKHATRRLMDFDQGRTGLGRGTRDYFLNKEKFHKHIAAYKNLLKRKATVLTEDSGLPVNTARISAGVDAVVDFETEFARIMVPEDERRNYSDLYHLVHFDELNKLMPSINWQRLFLSYTPKSVHNYIRGNPLIILNEPAYFQRLHNLLAKSDPEVVTNYMFFRFLAGFRFQLGTKFEEISQDFAKVLIGRKERPPRWKDCALEANDLMMFAAGAIYVRKHFSAEAKNSSLDMIVNLKEAIHEILVGNDWMDRHTKEYALSKANKMERLIGYPDFILDDKKLDQWYKDLDIKETDNFNQVVEKMNRYGIDYHYNLLLKRVDRMEWNENPATVNAFYSHIKNAIIFPAAMLQSPFFVKNAPKALNYGAIGAIIGHEITHGFDDQGRQFDGIGSLRGWWNHKTAENFEERVKCVMQQYGNVSVPHTNLNINGRLTLGENIADNGGIKEAFKAYQRFLTKHGEEKRLPGLEQFDNRQLFFLGYAQNWCGHATPEHYIRLILTDAHTPHKYRVNVVLQNQPEFAEAFKCSPNSAMNPTRRCGVW